MGPKSSDFYLLAAAWYNVLSWHALGTRQVLMLGNHLPRKVGYFSSNCKQERMGGSEGPALHTCTFQNLVTNTPPPQEAMHGLRNPFGGPDTVGKNLISWITL